MISRRKTFIHSSDLESHNKACTAGEIDNIKFLKAVRFFPQFFQV